MENNNLNISLIKQILFLEIKDYYDIINQRKNIEADISSLNEMIKILKSEDYETMMNNYILFDSLIPIFFSQSEEASNNILNLLYNSIYNCLSYIRKPQNFLEKDF